MIDIEKFQDSLLGWYAREARTLPWRDDPTPYKVWISEMMLQQTRVDTVIPYFDRFIAELPTVQALAEVGEDRLLKLWQELGYYNRALNLKKAAKMIVSEFNGIIPSADKELQSLPGIGAYSAGAIASIAFGKRVAAVDGNVLRVMARITASPDDIADPKVRKHLGEFVSTILPSSQNGDFTQALMELGAMICLPNGEPRCAQCPVTRFCDAFQQGLTAQIPPKSDKKQRKILKKTIFIILCNDRFALRKREDGGLLPNLWEFPNMPGHLTEQQCKEALEEMGLSILKVTAMKPAVHIFSHLEWHMTGYLVQAKEVNASPARIWATQNEITHLYSIPAAFKAFMPDGQAFRGIK
ncbi:MAG: A/G-specific adenine glycosylase [Saccharofermentanales bacterium]